MAEIAIYTHAQPLTAKEYHGERVITFKDMDTLHQRPEGTAKRNFNANRGRFIEGEDFFRVCADEIRTHKILELSPKAHEDIILLTKMGYLMLVKAFTDDLAWTVQRQLVKSYFEAHPVETTTPALMIPRLEGIPRPKMRTLPKAVAELKERDPQSCLTVTRLRTWVKRGDIPSRKAGKNFLVDLDEVERFMGVW